MVRTGLYRQGKNPVLKMILLLKLAIFISIKPSYYWQHCILSRASIKVVLQAVVKKKVKLW
jgi:hypothetical protein